MVTKKIYCYVDETGQDTKGKLFIVSIVVVGKDKDLFQKAVEEVEIESGKRRSKWGKTNYSSRISYLKKLILIKTCKYLICFSKYKTMDFDLATIQTISKTIHYKITSEIENKIISFKNYFPTKYSRQRSLKSLLLKDSHLLLSLVTFITFNLQDSIPRGDLISLQSSKFLVWAAILKKHLSLPSASKNSHNNWSLVAKAISMKQSARCWSFLIKEQ